MTPIYIPSRGRAGDAPTIHGVIAAGFRPLVVVPMGERNAYAKAYPYASIIALALSGIGRVRQWILTNARTMGHERMWMLDDDLTIAKRDAYNDPYRPCSWSEALLEMEDVCAHGAPGRERLALAGPMPRQFAWTQDAALWNRRCGYAVLIDTKAPFEYWPFYHEDTDAILQVLTQGWKTLLMPRFAFSTPAMGTKSGGCQDGYRAGEGVHGGQVLIEKWASHPGLVTSQINKAGATVTKVDWKRFREYD